MALAKDRNTRVKDGELISVPMAASTTVYGGGMAAINASGYTVPASDTASLKVKGIAQEQVDNSSGANGDLDIMIKRNKAFLLKNDTANPVAAAHLFTDVYVLDDETVSSDGGTNSIVAGLCVGIETAGVWVVI